MRRQLIEDLEGANVESALRSLGVPLLVLHSPEDEVVPIAHAERIFEAAPQPKSFVALDGADHLLMRDPADAQYVARVIALWAERHLA